MVRSMIMGFALVALLLAIFVVPCCAGLKAQFRQLPVWLPLLVIAVVLVAFLLVPMDSQAAVRVFANAGK
jgi:hypothetical protein